jgi:ribosomal-protein-alanine N-acetyltransferase
MSEPGRHEEAIDRASHRADLHLRWTLRRDMPAILAIEQAGFDHPWTEEEFLRVLRQRNCIGMVAEAGGPDGPVAGHMIYELNPDHLLIANLATCPATAGPGSC